MARTIVSSPSFLGTLLPSLSRRRGLVPQVRRISTRVKFSLHQLPPIDRSIDLNAIVHRADGLLYTLADAAVAVDGGTAASDSAAAAQKSGWWCGFISDAMEVVLKVESTLAMQNLQPKIKAIQQRYAGNQERIQLETSRLYRQAGVNPLAGQRSS